MKGLIIKEPWIDLILSGEKVWEIRGTDTKIRGTIALIKSGSGTVVGLCDIKDVIGPLSLNKIRRSMPFHAIPSNKISNKLPYPKTYAWVLDNTICIRKPVSYHHPRGAVIWVNLPITVVKQLFNQNTLNLQGKETQMTIAKRDLQALRKQIQTLEKKLDKLVAAAGKAEKPKAAKKAPAKRGSKKQTATDQVLGIINRSKEGVNTKTLMEKTGFNQKKVTNILQRTYKAGKITRVGKGIYMRA
jgi:hypothetical protein